MSHFSGNQLYTDLYTKPTDANNSLHFDLSPPSADAKNTPCQFLRIRRICSKIQDYDKHGLVKAAHFLARGYPSSLVLDAFIKARSSDRNTLLAECVQTTDDTFTVLVTTCHPTFNDLSQIVKRNWGILSHSSKTRDIHKRRLIIALRKPTNLRNLLVGARTDYHPNTTSKHPAAISGRTYNICEKIDCRYCRCTNLSMNPMG